MPYNMFFPLYLAQPLCLDQQPFSVKGQRVNILDFLGHLVATTQLCHYGMKVAKDIT